MEQTPAQKRAGIRQRLGTYFLGVAIGCMLVMMLLSARRAMLGPANAAGPAPAPTGAPLPSAP